MNSQNRHPTLDSLISHHLQPSLSHCWVKTSLWDDHFCPSFTMSVHLLPAAATTSAFHLVPGHPFFRFPDGSHFRVVCPIICSSCCMPSPLLFAVRPGALFSLPSCHLLLFPPCHFDLSWSNLTTRCFCERPCFCCISSVTYGKNYGNPAAVLLTTPLLVP